MGLIYKEQFKNKPKSISNLERLLVSSPDKELILPANYHLFELHSSSNNSKAITYKNYILENYPESPFAKIILNPEIELSNEIKIDLDSKKLCIGCQCQS